MPRCDECGLKGCVEVPWQYPLVIDMPIMFVGQAPGDTESITKRPFTGRAGKMAWRVMHEAGINKERVVITNACCCCPPDDRQPTLREIQLCNDRLEKEIHEAQPAYIVAFGEVAMIALTGKTKIKSQRGMWYPLLPKYNYDCMVMCTLHPSFLLRQRAWINEVIKDLREVQQAYVMGGIHHTIEVFDDPKWILDPPAHELAEHLERYAPYVTAIDIETPSELNMRKAEIIGISFCADTTECVAIDLTSGRFDNRWPVIKKFLEDKDARKVTQNGQFDVGCLETNGMEVRGLAWDTLYAEHTINSDLPGSLDYLRSRYTKIKPYKPTKQEMKEFERWDKERRLVYNAWDSVTTLEVMMAQQELMDPAQIKVLTTIELPLIWVFNRMERKGVLIDKVWMAFAYKELGPAADALTEQFLAETNGVSIGSPKQLKKLFDLMDTKEDTLKKQITRGHPQSKLMQMVLDYRGLNIIASTFLLGSYRKLDNGRLHTHFKIEGTGTGRPASEKPNLNNVPKWVREMFLADDGKVWIEGDYTQQELHTIAVVADEQNMLADLANGVSVHGEMCKVMTGRSKEELSDIEYRTVKSTVFGTAYGRTPRSIAIEFGITTAQAEAWQVACINKYPGLVRYRNTQLREFQETGRCRTAFGRVRIIQSGTQGYNTPVQSTAADITNTTLIKLDKDGIDLRLTVYDSVVAQADEGKEAEEVAAHMKEVMERPIPELKNHKFPAAFGIGKNWKELREW